MPHAISERMMKRMMMIIAMTMFSCTIVVEVDEDRDDGRRGLGCKGPRWNLIFLGYVLGVLWYAGRMCLSHTSRALLCCLSPLSAMRCHNVMRSMESTE
jgi:hypothetical protein